MSFVNHRGEYVDPYEMANPKRDPSSRGMKSVAERRHATHSMGFVVVGFSPEHLEAAETAHNEQRETQQRLIKSGMLERGVKLIREWDADKYMTHTKPPRVVQRPYQLEQAAEECAALCRRHGWQRVEVEELLRRDESENANASGKASQ